MPPRGCWVPQLLNTYQSSDHTTCNVFAMAVYMQAQVEAKDTLIQQQDAELQEKTAQINNQQTEQKELQKLRVCCCTIIHLFAVVMFDSVSAL